ncbi:FAD-dependent oxidoreductase [Limnohabitans sp.]|uniref:FAD-dependent oxidoreductase n=1 Tax=Limnohabitans sp. TaxID=1907725 RepID=UPI0038BA034D
MPSPKPPAHAWHGHSIWCITQATLDLPALLSAWAQWQTDPERPALLHVLAVAACAPTRQDLQNAANAQPKHAALVGELTGQCWGLLPGMHRLRLNGGQVLLTLCVGSPADHAPLLARYPTGPCTPSTAGHPLGERTVTVLGSGIAGAGTARALAERGWQVTVLDAGNTPAAGASGLPVGLVAPHTSPDDSLISRLSRAGVRTMQHAMRTLLQEGTDWGPSGVQERRLPGKTRKGGAPQSWSHELAEAGEAWTCAASPPAPPNALWHAKGAWLRPARLVHALLQHPNIRWQGQANADALRAVDTAQGTAWQVLQQGQVLAQSARVVVACGPGSAALLASATHQANTLPIRPLRGQISWGLMAEVTAPVPTAGMGMGTSRRTGARQAQPQQPGFELADMWPAMPVNGNGSFVHSVPTELGPAWFAGSSFDRVNGQPVVLPADHADNLARLQALLPDMAQALAPVFANGARGWAGVRCSVPDRLPVVGPVAHASESLWVVAAMGSRGLTLALLCGELLAAHWHGEPLPLEAQLAQALDANRFKHLSSASATHQNQHKGQP